MRRSLTLASLALGGALGAAGCAAGPDLSAPVGSSSNPVVCSGQPDEFAYLGRLVCTDGTAPHWKRVGNTPVGPYGAPLDRYRVRCESLDWETHVYFDRRHRPIDEKAAPEGLRLAPASTAVRWCGQAGGCSEP